MKQCSELHEVGNKTNHVAIITQNCGALATSETFQKYPIRYTDKMRLYLYHSGHSSTFHCLIPSR